MRRSSAQLKPEELETLTLLLIFVAISIGIVIMLIVLAFPKPATTFFAVQLETLTENH